MVKDASQILVEIKTETHGEGFLVAQRVKNPPAMRETWIRSLGWDDSLEKGKATHSSILAWRIPWTVLVCGIKKNQTRLSNFCFLLTNHLFCSTPPLHSKQNDSLCIIENDTRKQIY